ncbi:PREDICTED: F-box/LRR-repeat protein At2g43260-like isoform X1 [Brassica oleracea var. oleracea]|uniref:F-box domain-containing protein n=1 Tax=Brassica oleracea var. oleracea TaxID=109376 RepID=A0A0D3C8N5_BRAOL|nr:PREDICTED: F-box/LRR-repeat protein At2g43260-like isoform X1 [Brassica oleracea var. oleracea]
MRGEYKNPNSIYITPELLEEIFLVLPLKSILRFKTVSKQWRSILESEMFVRRRRRMNVQKEPKLLAAYKCRCGDQPSLLPESRFEGDEEIVCLHCGDARPSMSCDGLVCIPEPESIIVLNPSTGQLRRFPPGPDPLSSRFRNGSEEFFQGNWVMGFGTDIVTGSYKVVKMCVEPIEEECDLLSVESGEWRKLRLPPYVHHVGRKSVCVNGSIYWMFSGRRLQIGIGYKILALDLHKLEFHNVSVPSATWVTRSTEIVNLGERLAIAKSTILPEWTLEIWTMNANEEIWSKTFSINLGDLDSNLPSTRYGMDFTPVTVSKQGNVVFCNNFRNLFKYYSEAKEIHCLSLDTLVISPYIENLVPLWGHQEYQTRTCRCRLFSKEQEQCFKISKLLKWVSFGVLLSTSLVIFYYILIGLQGLATTTHMWWKDEHTFMLFMLSSVFV